MFILVNKSKTPLADAPNVAAFAVLTAIPAAPADDNAPTAPTPVPIRAPAAPPFKAFFPAFPQSISSPLDTSQIIEPIPQ